MHTCVKVYAVVAEFFLLLGGERREFPDLLEIRSEGENKGTEVLLYLPYPEAEEGESHV